MFIRDIVKIDTAIELKKLGFNYETYTYYDLKSESLMTDNEHKDWNTDDDKVSAPSFFVTAGWLLYEKDMYIEIFPEDSQSYEANRFIYDFIIWNGPKSYHEFQNVQSPFPEDDPYKAFELSIDECIARLNGQPTIKTDKEILEDTESFGKFKKTMDYLQGHSLDELEMSFRNKSIYDRDSEDYPDSF